MDRNRLLSWSMFYPLSLWIALRYTRAKKRNHFISFISLISILGIALGVMILITVLSVMNGFHQEIKGRILSMASHANISAYQRPFNDWQKALQQALQHEQVLAAAPYIETQVMLAHRQQVSGAVLRAIDVEQEQKVVDVAQHMVKGGLDSLQAGSFNIVLGQDLARALRVGLGDKITVVVPKLTTHIAGSMPRMKRFTVSGIFYIGMNEYDRGLALIALKDGAKLLKLGDAVSGIRLKLEDIYQARQVSRQLARQFGGAFLVSDWTDHHRNFFAALKMEKRMMALLLFFIVVIAAFNIVATLVMLVVDKRADIAILKTFGASPRQIMAIFIIQGSLIGAIGTLLGVIGGIALSLNIEQAVAKIEAWFGVQFIDPNIYYISTLPAHLQTSDVVLIAIGSFLCSFIMTLYPAWNAYRTLPAEALRYD